jgi:PAS domain S-box-containing protein
MGAVERWDAGRGVIDVRSRDALLLDAASALLASRTSRRLLDGIYGRLSELAGLEVYAHFGLEEDGDDMAIGQGLTVAERDALSGVIRSCPSTGLFETASAAQPIAAALRAAGLTHCVCHPLIRDGPRLGTILFATRGDDVSADAPDLIHRLGDLVAVALARSRAEDALETSAAEYRQLFASVDEGMCTMEMIFDARGDPVDYRFLEVNPVFEAQTGLRDPVGRTARELVPDLDEFWFQTYGEVARTGQSRRFQNHAPAMQRWFDVHAFRVGAPAQRRVGLLFRDVSERKLHERNIAFLAEMDAQLAVLAGAREIMDASARTIAEHLGFFRVVFAEVDENVEFVRIFHEWRSATVPTGLGVHRVADFAGAPIVETLKAGRPAAVSDVATDIRTADKADNYAKWGIRAQVHAPHFSGGRLRFVLGGFWSAPHECHSEMLELMSELSARVWLRLERAWTEDSLRESERRFRTIADTAPVVLWMTDEHNACTFLNNSWTVLTGQPKEAGLGDGWGRFVHPEDREPTWRTFVDATERRQPFSLDCRLIDRDGHYRWAVAIGTPRYDPEGRWVGYIGSITDVHDRKLAEERLREADRRKNRFMAVLSHELRNPLTPIKHGLHILDEVEPQSDTARRVRRIMNRQVELLARLVDDLLDLTRVTRGTVELRRERLELGALVRHTVEDHRSLFEDKGVQLHCRSSPEPVLVDGDSNRLLQVVGNLLQNAVKFTSRGGETRVTVARHGEHAVIRVTDTGMGMEPSTIAGLFQPFMQADASLARASGGLGLGLALVRSIVELHGGTVTAKSAGLGRGSAFEVSLPLASAETPEKSEASATTGLRPLSILLIEDSPDVAESMQMLLEMEGHEVSAASDGAEGLAKARATRPDVVLCDLGLPGIDGYAVARALAADPELATIHRVAVSGYALPEDVQRSNAAGFHDHLAKPAALESLRRVLANVPLSDS